MRAGPEPDGKPDHPPAGDRRGGTRRVRWLAAGLLLVVAAALLVTADDLRAHGAVTVLESTIPNARDTGEVEALKRAAAGGRIQASDLWAAIEFIREGNDGSDFRLITLLRLAHQFGARLDPSAEAALRDGLAGVRWWMDEPGMTPAVYWSENHQLLWATAEYLAGQRYPDLVMRDGRTGEAHRMDAEERLRFWLDQRWRFGFSEWNSHYYGEDIAALATLADFAAQADLAATATAALDRVLLDIAAHTGAGEFIASSGRLYEANRTSGDDGVRRIVARAFQGMDGIAGADGIEINFLLSGYRTPAALVAVARDPAPMVVTQSFGRDVGDLGTDPSLDTAERRVMALWGMQAFTNPEAIETTIDYVRATGLLANPSLAPLRQLDFRVLRATGALPVVSRVLDLPSNGMALERADVYAYRNPDFLLSTTQAYRPGGFGNQEAIVQLTLGQGLSLFHNHPAVRSGGRPPNGNSPGYWTGDGHLPVACQDHAVSVAVYSLPSEPGFGRSEALPFTHLRVPLDRFERAELDGNRLFLQRGDALVAVTGSTTLRQQGDDELVQDGLVTAWVIEAASSRDETFEAFTERIRSATVDFDGRELAYQSGGPVVAASLDQGCRIDGAPIEVPYARVPSPYAAIDGEGRLSVVAGDRRLDLDPETGSRSDR